MSNFLDTSAVTPTIRMPLKEGSIQFLQEAWMNVISTMNRQNTFGYSNVGAYIIYGCVRIDSGGTTTISEGAIFHHGEVLYSPLQSFTAPVGPDTVIANLKITQYTTNADPVLFSDSVPRDVHNIREVEYSVGTSGAGDIEDFNNFINADNLKDGGNPTLTAAGGGSVSLVGATVSNLYKFTKRTLTWEINISALTISGTVSEILVDLPTDVFNTGLRLGTSAFATYNVFAGFVDGAWALKIRPDTTRIVLRPISGANFATGAADRSFGFHINLDLRQVSYP